MQNRRMMVQSRLTHRLLLMLLARTSVLPVAAQGEARCNSGKKSEVATTERELRSIDTQAASRSPRIRTGCGRTSTA